MKLSLDDTWKYCLSMWKTVSEKQKKDKSADVEELKNEWATANGFTYKASKVPYREKVEATCFFCDYATRHGSGWPVCGKCPAKKVDPYFDCIHSEYNYEHQPIKFYNKIVSLNRKRLKLGAKK